MNLQVLKKYLKILPVLAVLFQPIDIIGQNDNDPSIFLPKINPPSPEAFKFSLYGNTPIGLFTGTPNISLPLFTYKTTNLALPYNLTYSSGGIKVDEINTKTGLGWTMVGGGVITRIVRNLEDDYYEDFPMKHLDITTVPESVMKNMYFYLFGENQGKDSERDIFMFNFPGHSGKFYFDNNNKIVFLDKCDIKVELIPGSAGSIYTFVITAEDGVKYYFQQTELTMLNTYGAGHTEPNIKTSAWYLNKIVHPKGDEIYFTYNDVGENYVQSESQQASKASPIWQTCASGQGYTKGITFGPVYSHNIRITGKSISDISSNNPFAGSVAFTYEDKISGSEPGNVIKTITIKNKGLQSVETINFDYLVTPNKRIFLNSFNFSEPENKYSFTYINPSSLPERLSRSQDHWGYFNGAANTATLLPRIEGSGFENFAYNAANREIDQVKVQTGLLNKIVYPTKGYTELEYASNDYYGTKKVMPLPVNKELTLDNDNELRHTTISTTFKADFGYEAKFTGATYFDNCDPQYNTGGNHHRGYVTVLCIEDNNYVPIYQYSDAYSQPVTAGDQSVVLTSDASIPYYFRVEQNKNYKVMVVNDYNCIHTKINVQYYTGSPQIINTNLLTGGCRVKSTKDYSLNNPPIIKKYYYAKFDSLNMSSGDNFEVPNYLNFSDHTSESGVNDLSCTVTDAVLNSSSVSSLFEMGSNVYYRYVTVGGGDTFENGYEENEFLINKDYREHIYLGDREFRNVPWSNLGWNNGKLLKTKIFENQSGSYKLRKEVINTYLKDASNPTLINFAIYNPAQGRFINNFQEQCLCTAANTSKSYPVKYCSAIHIHQPDINGDCTASGASNVNFNIPHPCLGKTVGSLANIPTINHLDVMPYKYISYFVYLSNTTTNEYDKNGANPLTTITDYKYDSTKHFQLTSQTVKNSEGEDVQTKYFYPSDPEMTNKPFVSNLITANMIGTPLDTQNYNGTTKLLEQLTIYEKSAVTNNKLLPKSIYAAKFPNVLPTVLTDRNLEKKITFDQYDDNGNIVQYTPESGIPVAVIWGYNKTQPIAKIENATYSEVSSYIANLQTKSDTGTEADLITALTALRTALPAKMVTTFTYLPLIGVSTITDPKGSITTYLYDTYNRLKVVKDNGGKIISENLYHYQN